MIHFVIRQERRDLAQRSGHEDVQTAAGYSEIYNIGDKWFAYHEIEGGSSQGTFTTKEEAVADIERTIEIFTSSWEGKVRWREEGDCTPDGRPVVRADGVHFVISPDLSQGVSRGNAGYGGAKFVFRMLETGNVITSRNVWCQGRIPTDYRDRLPDNAELIPERPVDFMYPEVRRQESIAGRTCVEPPIGCGGSAHEFRDEISIREYRITGLCQSCQDSMEEGSQE
jgi:hypothetical protein